MACSRAGLSRKALASILQTSASRFMSKIIHSITAVSKARSLKDSMAAAPNALGQWGRGSLSATQRVATRRAN